MASDNYFPRLSVVCYYLSRFVIYSECVICYAGMSDKHINSCVAVPDYSSTRKSASVSTMLTDPRINVHRTSITWFIFNLQRRKIYSINTIYNNKMRVPSTRKKKLYLEWWSFV
jgi:hypothetical protein